MLILGLLRVLLDLVLQAHSDALDQRAHWVGLIVDYAHQLFEALRRLGRVALHFGVAPRRFGLNLEEVLDEVLLVALQVLVEHVGLDGLEEVLEKLVGVLLLEAATVVALGELREALEE